jgi:hypothetical protein
MKRLPACRALATIILLAPAAALALINPRFTPNDLVAQSDQIFLVRLAAPAGGGETVTMNVVEALKGNKPDKAPVLNLAAAAQKEWAAKVGKEAATREAPALLFIGSRKEQGQPDEAAVKGAALQIDRMWVLLEPGKSGAWDMVRVDEKMQGTWDGGSDMLLKVVQHVLKHPDDIVPVIVGFDWAGMKSAGKVEGEVFGSQAVDLDGKGSFVFFVQSAGGDRLIGWDATRKEFADLTAARKLSAKSRAAAWGDFTGDGRLDLATWDGTTLRIIPQVADGTFGAGVEVAFKPEGGCASLAALDVGSGKRAGLLAATGKGPVVLRPDGEGYKAEPVPGAAGLVASLGVASGCVVADLDGDGVADVFQPFEKGTLVCKGKGGGAFAAPTKLEIGTEKGPAACCTGDYDADGLLDIYAMGAGCCHLWNNRGGLSFMEAFGHSGEMSYVAQPGGVACQTCDINNDGLQDVFLAIATEHPQLYFSRGFRSFGKSLSLVWENGDFTSECKNGTTAGTVADFNGDGAPDMAVVLTNGNVLVWLRAGEGDESRALGVQVMVTPATAGPVAVTGWNSQRCLGAWNVVPGAPGAFFGLSSPGIVKFKWQFPGGAPQERTVAVENKVKPVFLGADAK